MRSYTHIICALLMAYVFIIILKALNIDIIANTFELFIYFMFIIISSIFLDYFEALIFEDHKRQLHTLFILIIPILIIFLFFIPLNFPIGFGILAGLSSHLLLDLLTPHGCPLLYPLNNYYYKVFTRNKSQIKTGSAKERGFALCLLIVLIITVIGSIFLLPGLYGFIPDAIYSAELTQNGTNVSYSDSPGNINVNLNIHEDEEKNLTFIDENNRTTTLLIKNYDSDTTS